MTGTSCADSHTDFLQKCNNPLWLNSEFFVSLPFKENIQTIRTKASHAGMPPTLLQQANDECDQLVRQGVVSTTNSLWACKAFDCYTITISKPNKVTRSILFFLPPRHALESRQTKAMFFVFFQKNVLF